MIGALFTASWRHLRRDRAALLLSFAFPVAFFSVSALAFQRLHRSPSEPLGIHVVDLDRSAASRRLVEALGADRTVALWQEPPGGCSERDCAVATVARSIEAQRASGGLVLTAGFGADADPTRGSRIILVAADSDPVAALRLERSAADALAGGPPRRFALPVQRVATTASGSARLVRGALSGLLVVFLLFTAAGASGWLIEEEQQATLSLLLTTRAGIGRILGSQWLFLSSLGTVQALVMLLWATLFFGLPWAGAAQALGVSLVVLATAATTAAFGLFLAALVRTRAQLGAASTISILLLSAVGGSFVPQAALPGPMQTAGRAVPTTWAVAGLWQALDPRTAMGTLLPAITTLAGFATVLLLGATLLARRRVVA
jgi:ABC-2 type transport system permease protein